MAAKLDFTKIKAKLESIHDEFEGKEAKIGWFESAKYPDGMPVANIALIQEKGAPAAGVPARPFLKPAIDANQEAWVDAIKSGVPQVVAGNMTAEDVLEIVGQDAVGAIVEQIERGTVAPLTPTTLLLRKWRREGRKITGATVGEAAAAVKANPSLINGVNADPLRDTGHMVATITSVVGSSS